MRAISQRRLRIVLASLLVVSLAVVGYGYAESSRTTTFESHLDDEGLVAPDAQVAPPGDGITVIATDSNSWRGQVSDGPRARAELVALDPDGTVRYYDDDHTRYWDVDPVPGVDATVEYSYADHLDAEDCPDADEWDPDDYGVDESTWDTYYEHHGDVDACTYNGVERVNLTTGEVEQVWGQHTPGKAATRYHDVDRLNETHIVVADIYLDGVFVVDTATDDVVRRWNASDSFDPEETGGPHPADWSHINDVEVLDDGRIVVSARNLDRVVFLTPDGEAVDGAWTLGSEDDHDVLYEQHNPDFVPAENGGPAAVVADSENNRVLEYQRADDGEWTRTWQWRDARVQWARDADRLPNGHTLITDSNGNRVFEVDEEGTVVWSLDIGFPYEAERLDTGDESTGGPSAQSAGVASQTGTTGDQVLIAIKDLVPGKYLNGLLYITPVWMGLLEVVAVVVGLLGALLWGVLEGRRVVRRRWRSAPNPTEVRQD